MSELNLPINPGGDIRGSWRNAYQNMLGGDKPFVAVVVNGVNVHVHRVETIYTHGGTQYRIPNHILAAEPDVLQDRLAREEINGTLPPAQILDLVWEHLEFAQEHVNQRGGIRR